MNASEGIALVYSNAFASFRRPVEDVVCSDADYRRLYAEAGLAVHEFHQPLGQSSDGIAWVSEATVAPWSIYVLGAAPEGAVVPVAQGRPR